MKAMMRPVHLEEAQEESLFGGKAVQLGVARRAGLPVPPGFALPVDFAGAVESGDPQALAALVRLRSALEGPLAVRSSAVGEDSAGASFAGQHLTRLGVRSRAALRDAVRAVRRSASSDAALAYRERLGLAGTTRMAVVVQQLVPAESAGVLFDRNPVSGADERVIEAVWGLGEAGVAGLVAPDRYRIERSGSVLERMPGTKHRAIELAPGEGTAEREVAPELVNALCLDDAQLGRLHELAGRCERIFGGGQDLEWAFAHGELHLLQRRAITSALR
jgi:pyruvate,water dikinase